MAQLGFCQQAIGEWRRSLTDAFKKSLSFSPHMWNPVTPVLGSQKSDRRHPSNPPVALIIPLWHEEDYATEGILARFGMPLIAYDEDWYAPCGEISLETADWICRKQGHTRGALSVMKNSDAPGRTGPSRAMMTVPEPDMHFCNFIANMECRKGADWLESCSWDLIDTCPYGEETVVVCDTDEFPDHLPAANDIWAAYGDISDGQAGPQGTVMVDMAVKDEISERERYSRESLGFFCAADVQTQAVADKICKLVTSVDCRAVEWMRAGDVTDPNMRLTREIMDWMAMRAIKMGACDTVETCGLEEDWDLCGPEDSLSINLGTVELRWGSPVYRRDAFLTVVEVATYSRFACEIDLSCVRRRSHSGINVTYKIHPKKHSTSEKHDQRHENKEDLGYVEYNLVKGDGCGKGGFTAVVGTKIGEKLSWEKFKPRPHCSAVRLLIICPRGREYYIYIMYYINIAHVTHGASHLVSVLVEEEEEHVTPFSSLLAVRNALKLLRIHPKKHSTSEKHNERHEHKEDLGYVEYNPVKGDGCGKGGFTSVVGKQKGSALLYQDKTECRFGPTICDLRASHYRRSTHVL
eukprot:sb/3463374/